MAKRELLKVDRALEIVLAGVSPLETEKVPLAMSGGRFTAAAVESSIDLPGFDNSVMDGYALKASDTAEAKRETPLTLTVAGESRAGAPFSGNLESGQAIGISTGAAIPAGADAVLQKELVDTGSETDRETITVTNAIEPGRDIRFQGEVIKTGSRILAPGTRIGSVEIGALASIGLDQVPCHRLPRVSLVTSGDELVDPGKPLGPGQIWNSNHFAIAGMIGESGAEMVDSGSVIDDRQATVEALSRSLEADLTVVCGGVSVGEHDHVRPALEELGVEQLFWGLALKPGRPTWFGRRGESRVIGLPGNPVSAVVVFRMFALPLIRMLAGGSAPGPRSTAVLASPVDRLAGRLHAVPCHPTGPGKTDELVPMPQLGSHDFLSLLGASRLALIEPGSGRVEAGESVETLTLGDE